MINGIDYELWNPADGRRPRQALLGRRPRGQGHLPDGAPRADRAWPRPRARHRHGHAAGRAEGPRPHPRRRCPACSPPAPSSCSWARARRISRRPSARPPPRIPAGWRSASATTTSSRGASTGAPTRFSCRRATSRAGSASSSRCATATVPIVRRTGGLADTVREVDAARRTGTGFLFDAFAVEPLARGGAARAAAAHRVPGALERHRAKRHGRGLLLGRLGPRVRHPLPQGAEGRAPADSREPP